MIRRTISLWLGAALVTAVGCGSKTPQCASTPPKPQLFAGMGGFHREVSGASPAAQKYVDQGLKFGFAFNHDEAIRTFTEAARLSPDCAMAWYGIAFYNGPHINNPAMDDEHSK